MHYRNVPYGGPLSPNFLGPRLESSPSLGGHRDLTDRLDEKTYGLNE
jgi:hypothetical protein